MDTYINILILYFDHVFDSRCKSPLNKNQLKHTNFRVLIQIIKKVEVLK